MINPDYLTKQRRTLTPKYVCIAGRHRSNDPNFTCEHGGQDGTAYPRDLAPQRAPHPLIAAQSAPGKSLTEGCAPGTRLEPEPEPAPRWGRRWPGGDAA
jgi:hypothetical protein